MTTAANQIFLHSSLVPFLFINPIILGTLACVIDPIEREIADTELENLGAIESKAV